MNLSLSSVSASSHDAHRAVCLRCLKSQFTCYCSEVRAFRTGVQIVLLQHPRERKKAIGTARMAHLAIENSVLICDRQFTSNDRVNSLIADPSLQCVVLFPGPHSVNLSLIPPSQVQAQFDADRKLLIFVIDGTWAEAKRMVRQSANLCGLPQICFTPQRPSEYKIRQQPHEYCVSSIEAVHQLLGILDPSTDADHLLELFRSMVALQIQCFQKNRMPELLQVPEYAGTI